MYKKEMFEKKKVILGFDETNNGFGLKCFNNNHESNLVITGYLAEEINMKGYHRAHYETKGKLFDGKRDTEQALKRGRAYLSEHPDFLYTSIPKELQKTRPIAILKAEAVALLTINFFQRFDLDIFNTKIIMDEMDGKNQSTEVNRVLDLWLKKADLNLPHRSMRSGASNVYAVRKADMVGYYLTAIHFLGMNKKWPYRAHRIGFSQLESSVIDFLETREPSFS